jgi:predicted  nucleic acid-binding Zn-ribbon protein
MNADLEKLIALQQLDSAASAAKKTLSEEPEHERTLATRLDAAKAGVAEAKEHVSANASARREIEKDVAVHQSRLSKFREQAMAVKTNQEYHAIQHEIAFAQTGIKSLEDKILELMVAADDLSAGAKKADAVLAAEQKAIDADRKKMQAEHAELEAALARIAGERATLVGSLTPQVLATFELVSKRRNGIGVAEARDGICTICHVRLRPQVFNTMLKNEAIIQCDSCQRILYYIPPVPGARFDVQEAANPEPERRT